MIRSTPLDELCKQYEHNNSHWIFILDNTIFVWLSWFEKNWLFCFCCSFVPKINVQIGTEQELEEVDMKYFSMAPPTMWVMVYSLGCPVARGGISWFGTVRATLRPATNQFLASRLSIVVIGLLMRRTSKVRVTNHKSLLKLPMYSSSSAVATW